MPINLIHQITHPSLHPLLLSQLHRWATNLKNISHSCQTHLQKTVWGIASPGPPAGAYSHHAKSCSSLSSYYSLSHLLLLFLPGLATLVLHVNALRVTVQYSIVGLLFSFETEHS